MSTEQMPVSKETLLHDYIAAHTGKPIQPLVSEETRMNDFIAANKEKMDANLLRENVERLKACNAKTYIGAGWFHSYLFYLTIDGVIETGAGEKSYSGQGGGLAKPGSAVYGGDLYTDDLPRLFRDTISFEYQCAIAYFSILFFDSHSNLLGHLECGAIGLPLGIGGEPANSHKWGKAGEIFPLACLPLQQEAP